MSCFPCFQRQRSNSSNGDQGGGGSPPGEKVEAKGVENRQSNAGNAAVENINVAAKAFTFRELATATKNFRQECLLGEGGFGRVFRGVLASTGQVVAVKQMDRNIIKGDNKEFLNEVSSLGRLNHSNLLNLIGYCADGDQRLLVFEFMPGGSLENHLLGTKEALDWSTRIKIAFGAAKGVEYLHCKANPPVVYQNIKPSNILLDEDFNPKIADFGLSKLGPSGGDKLFGPSRAIGTYGYSAPECAGGNDPTAESDVYTFGVILLQLITGRKALDTTRPNDEQNLVAWAQPFFKDPKRFPDMADPLLHKQYPEKDLNQSVAVAAMCLQEEPAARPMMSDVVTTLSFIWMTAEKYVPSPVPPSPAPSVEEHSGHDQPKTEVIPDNKSTGSSKRKDSVVKDRQVSQHKKQSSSGREDDNSESGEGSSEEEDGSSEEEYYDNDDYDYDDEDEDEDDEKEDDDDEEEYESSDDKGSNNSCKSSKKLGTKSRKSRRESVRLGDNSTRKSAADQDDKPIGQKSRAKSSKSRCKRIAKSHKLSDGDTNGSFSRGKSKSLCAKSSKASKRRSSRHKDGSKSSKRSEDDDGMFSFGS